MPFNYNNFGQGQGGGQGFLPMGGGSPYTGGTFGPAGGIQGRGELTPEELALLRQMGGGGGGGPTLPAYNDPALAGPAQTPQIETGGLGINPEGMAQGGSAGMDFGTGAIDQGVGAIGDATMQMALERAEQERWRKMIEMQAQMSGAGGIGAGGPTAVMPPMYGGMSGGGFSGSGL